HCVRSFSEIISLKKRLNPAQAWIIHGFNKNNETGRQLIDAGFYLSFGAALLHPNTTNFISQMPLHRLFFETDALPEVSIEQVYERAANLCNMELPHLQAQVAENFEQIFL
ncbi:MAG: TatD family hydrolase, partial [Bacteroidetes bacterium]|nr:TatD family hydrolase [Bacteroidota bacterium]